MFYSTSLFADISGKVYEDIDDNCIISVDEPGIPDVTVTLTSPDGSVSTTLTDDGGNYSFSNLSAGDYVIVADLGLPCNTKILTIDFSGNIITIDFSDNCCFKCGQAVVTCYSGSNPSGHVLGIKNIRDKSIAQIGSNWTPPVSFAHPDWTSSVLGEVFGIAIDENYNIYLSATIAYETIGIPPISFGAGGGGGIYKIDASTGNVSTFASLPNPSGVGLGNICYDKSLSQFFVTNFEDGKIYRLSNTSNILSTFDPFSPDDPTTSCAPQGERIWGIGTYNNKLYFGLCNNDLYYKGSGLNEIYSVDLDASGAIISAPYLEITLPVFPGENSSSPVSDIAFSNDGKMLVAERGLGVCDTLAYQFSGGVHKSRVLEYVLVGSDWTLSQEFFIGNYGQNRNSSGGVDYGYDDFLTNAPPPIPECDNYVWATGDALRLDTQSIYGIAGIPARKWT